jgi:phosphoribosylformylglycinamidine (FGAM) synthase-like enzyme
LSHVLAARAHALCFASVLMLLLGAGAEIDIRAVRVGDATLSVMEIWGAEYQENDALLIRPSSRSVMEEICKRERCDMQVRQLGSSRSDSWAAV